ncbi:hypothetical protein RRG08_022154 [Elysia crispata]|uniref:Uncharacterized protein n=1 Tax=Elysia crispata TaxID=231223 RepID=A0AAE1DYM3_9GAST|nr:hypothetical protein RRG08_022154 [Elysia crispata]
MSSQTLRLFPDTIFFAGNWARSKAPTVFFALQSQKSSSWPNLASPGVSRDQNYPDNYRNPISWPAIVHSSAKALYHERPIDIFLVKKKTRPNKYTVRLSRKSTHSWLAGPFTKLLGRVKKQRAKSNGLGLD